MKDKLPYGFPGFGILLTTVLTIPSLNFSIAVETVLLLPFLKPAHER
jgi:hypothetical protein